MHPVITHPELSSFFVAHAVWHSSKISLWVRSVLLPAAIAVLNGEASNRDSLANCKLGCACRMQASKQGTD
jgi:hypothetical protein